MIKLKIFNLKRRLPTCYLLSSKSILTLAIILFTYILIMDIKLFGMARTRGAFVSSKTINKSLTRVSLLPLGLDQHQSPGYSLFRPLPVKKIMMAEATHYIRSPLAEFVEHGLGFSTLFPFISANFISLTHCALSVISIKFLAHESLFWRQVGVCLFQFRNFLDSFDGVIYRSHAKRSTYKSHYGSIGYFVDAVSDVFGGFCLIGAVAIYLLKCRPLNKNLTKCFRIADDVEDSAASLIQINSPNEKSDVHTSPLSSPLVNSKNGYFFRFNKTASCNESGVYASRVAILLSVALLGIRLGLSALFWDRSVHTYEDLLDSPAKSDLHEVNKCIKLIKIFTLTKNSFINKKQLQINVLKSTITLFIMISWRVMCALSLQDMILVSIFIDKIWVNFYEN